MMPGSLRLLRVLAGRKGDVGEIAQAILDIEGERSGEQSAETAPVSSAAARMRRLRAERNREQDANTGEHGANKSEQKGELFADVREQPSPSLVLSPSPSSLDSSEISSPSEKREEPESDSKTARASANVRSEQGGERSQRTEPANATNDGAFGLLVPSWADGIRSVTGSAYMPPRGRAGGHLGEVLRGAVEGAPDTCARARELGAEYARANPGKTLSPFHFGDWLGSGKPERGSEVRRRGGHVPQPVPEGGSIWKEGT